jgi:6-phosphofructokinase 2
MTILTLSLNPTIDASSEADVVRPTRKIRTSNETYEPGGGGVNVARAIVELGGEAELVCPAGGTSGHMLDSLLGRSGVRRRLVPIAGDTRISHTVFERSTAREYRFVPLGPTLSPAEIEACLAAIETASFDYLVASGSAPPGAQPDVLARVAGIAAARDAKFVLDSSGPGLSVTLERAPVYLVKPNMGEMEDMVGRRCDEETVGGVAMELVDRGRAEIVAVTMGPAGAVVASKAGIVRVRAPSVEARSAVGSGDSFLAAMTLALSREWSLEEATVYAVAAGAAAALTPGTRLCLREDVDRLYDRLHRAPARQ